MPRDLGWSWNHASPNPLSANAWLDGTRNIKAAIKRTFFIVAPSSVRMMHCTYTRRRPRLHHDEARGHTDSNHALKRRFARNHRAWIVPRIAYVCSAGGWAVSTGTTRIV